MSPFRWMLYVREACRPGMRGGLPSLVRDFAKWCRNGNERFDLLANGTPWLPFSAIRFLERITTTESRVFEFGCGGSTAFFAERAASVRSVDHDSAWCERVRSDLARRGLQAEVSCMPPESNRGTGDPTDPDSYSSSDERHSGCSFHRYAAAIDLAGEFDIVLIDGRARPSCAKHAASHIAPGGWLVLDNSDRPGYHRIHEMMSGCGWPRRQFAGPGPGAAIFWETTFWQRPEAPPCS